LARLAERLLALARAEGAQPLADDWVDLAQVVKLTIAEFEHDARLAGRRIVAECGSARVRGDLDAVGLAVRNLLENALVHGAGGSFIRVACRNGRGWSAIAVIDDGPGVKGIDVRRLTRRFTRAADAAPGGAGLGLSIVDTLARRMGARLELVSPPTGLARGFEARVVWDAASAAVLAAPRRAVS
jgi:two-component system OmpR family sensor kinase